MINQNLLLTGDAGYNLTKSLRFRSSASAYLNRTPAGSPTSTQKFTQSYWVKRGTLSTTQYIYNCEPSDWVRAYIFSDNILYFDIRVSGTNYSVGTTQVFRDPSAWYHIVISVDTTQATAANRLIIYVNGVQAPTNTPTIPQNSATVANSANPNFIGAYKTPNQYFDGYLAEVNFIDGQALTPSSFGETSTTTGVWIPKKYTGTYGTNGFYLPFTDTTSTSTLGTDFSGNSNTWTVNNISLTSGSTYDSMTDVPTLTSTTTANYCTLNPLQTTQSATAPTNGNLTSPANAGVWRRIGSTMQLPTTGKFYFEYNCDSFSSFATFSIGVFSGALNTANEVIGTSSTEWGYNAQSGYASNNSSNISSGFTTATTGDVLQLAYDASTGSLWFGKNNTWQGASSPNPSTGTSPTYTGVYNVSPVMVQNWATQSVNFGQRPFAYTPPTGFLQLNTFNLPTPTIGATASELANEYMDVTLWTGDGTTNTRSFTNSGSMQPDWIWTKARSATWAHNIFDSVRGFANDKGLNSNLTDAEGTNRNGYVSAANSNGFSMANGTSGNQYYNENGTTYVGWQWRASNTTPVSNTAGSITSTVSANTTAGFSIVTYTGTGANATVGHGLGVAPSMIIIKNRSTVTDWPVYHSSNTTSPATQRVLLNTTDATATSSTYWNNTAPTSSVFSISTYSGVNGNTNAMVAYCFAQVAGYSAFGSYTGNGSTDGTFVYTGFRPAFVLTKRTDSSGNWYLWDNKRIISANGDAGLLYPDSSIAESDYNASGIDLLSNGFKLRNTDSSENASGGTYIYACFAEFPFKFSNAR